MVLFRARLPAFRHTFVQLPTSGGDPEDANLKPQTTTVLVRKMLPWRSENEWRPASVRGRDTIQEPELIKKSKTRAQVKQAVVKASPVATTVARAFGADLRKAMSNLANTANAAHEMKQGAVDDSEEDSEDVEMDETDEETDDDDDDNESNDGEPTLVLPPAEAAAIAFPVQEGRPPSFENAKDTPFTKQDLKVKNLRPQARLLRARYKFATSPAYSSYLEFKADAQARDAETRNQKKSAVDEIQRRKDLRKKCDKDDISVGLFVMWMRAEELRKKEEERAKSAAGAGCA